MKTNELKATDLMIGDWLKHYNDTPMQVTKITTEHFACAENRGMNCWEYNNKYKPILLTPEILEKNGFEKAEDIQLYYYYLGIDNRVSLHDYACDINSSNTWHVHIDSEDYSTIATCELTYVHELQHILRLCKIDKEIVV